MGDQASRQDRELNELLTELRVALPGVQVMFAFLLSVPFTQRFVEVTSVQKGAYFAAFLLTAAATAFLIAPTAYHRLRWRAHDKEHMLVAANRFAVVGIGFLAAAMVFVVFLITDFLFSGLTAVVTTATGITFATLWFVLPLMRAIQAGDPKEHEPREDDDGEQDGSEDDASSS